MIQLIGNTGELQNNFRRLTSKFDKIEIISAWIGNPSKGIPYEYLNKLKRIDVYAGISFCQTHPDGIKYFLKLKQCKNLSLIDEPFTFHMKLYHFYNDQESALIMGSTNFTLSGFTDNAESNVVLEGKENQTLIIEYVSKIKNQISDYKKININDNWLETYTNKYKIRQQKLKEARVSEDSIRDEIIQNDLVWLRNGSWDDYLKEFNKTIEKTAINKTDFITNKVKLLELYKTELPIPWTSDLFDKAENRAMLLGTKNKFRDFGWLGHMQASGGFGHLLLNGVNQEKRKFCNAINKISELVMPLDLEKLLFQLSKLTETGPSIKVWGRPLTMIKPDTFCTISSDLVRDSLSKLLSKPKSFFTTIDGYVYLLKIIYQSPWYNSPEPKDEIEKLIWRNRCAFLDVIFRNGN